jgi:periplasmic protein TonB
MRLVRIEAVLFAAILSAFLSPGYGVASRTPDQTQTPGDSSQPGPTGAAQGPDGKSRPQRIRVGGNVQAAKIISRVQPQYPKNAKEQRITGTVRLHVIIGTNGSVQEVTVMSGEPSLADAAVEAVRQWKYKVSTIHGEPVEIETVVDVNFSLTS